ncbi:chromosome partition protein Smc [Striga asiatica]|uniref:Chromosome partition protein Smc n=1 Tax=Striga asiatica TaxID=4170 RepID=A0A5A7QGP9_STRAF|nr:chromosome partition protein Smc [Striga asiatica]
MIDGGALVGRFYGGRWWSSRWPFLRWSTAELSSPVVAIVGDVDVTVDGLTPAIVLGAGGFSGSRSRESNSVFPLPSLSSETLSEEEGSSSQTSNKEKGKAPIPKVNLLAPC